MLQVVVARIGRPHGLRGEVSVEVRTDEPELRLAVGCVLATDPATAGPLTVASVHWHSGRLLLSFTGVEDRDAAEALRGVLLKAGIDPAARPADPEEFYDRQLVGLGVCTVDGTVLGTVCDVVHLPAQDLLVVGRTDAPDLLIPLVVEIVPTIDLDAGRIVVTPPPGLLDLHLDLDTGGHPDTEPDPVGGLETSGDLETSAPETDGA